MTITGPALFILEQAEMFTLTKPKSQSTESLW